jgi:hypothetical protein
MEVKSVIVILLFVSLSLNVVLYRAWKKERNKNRRGSGGISGAGFPASRKLENKQRKEGKHG